MTPRQIQTVTDAVTVENAHAKEARAEGRGSRCRCGYCVDARDAIADNAADMLEFIREALSDSEDS